MEQVKAVTVTVRALARTHGGGADTATAAAARAWDLLAVHADDAVRSAYAAAVSELLTLAGWTCVDSGLYDHARDHFAAAMTTAGQAEDEVALASALRCAGAADIDRCAWDDALKAFQLGLFRLGASTDPRAPAMAAVLHGESARALAAMDQPDAARAALGRARDGWEPPDAFAAANADLVAALVTMRLGRMDTAESFAMTSVRGWGEARRDRVISDVTLARIHLRAGEPDGAVLSQRAIEGVTETGSVRAGRVWLASLGVDLAARRDSTCQDLAERVRQIVTAA